MAARFPMIMKRMDHVSVLMEGTSGSTAVTEVESLAAELDCLKAHPLMTLRALDKVLGVTRAHWVAVEGGLRPRADALKAMVTKKNVNALLYQGQRLGSKANDEKTGDGVYEAASHTKIQDVVTGDNAIEFKKMEAV